MKDSTLAVGEFNTLINATQLKDTFKKIIFFKSISYKEFN